MTDQVPSQRNTNFAGVGGAVVSIVAGTGLHSLATPGHLAISLDQFSGGAFPGVVPGAPPLTPIADYLAADGTWQPIPAGSVPFAAGQVGIVSDPGAAPATDYLGADNTFRPIPASGVIASINGDATPAQTIVNNTGEPFFIGNPGGGVHQLNLYDFSSTQKGGVPDPSLFGPLAILTVNGWLDGHVDHVLPAAGIALVNGALTVIGTLTIPALQTGRYYFSYGTGVNGIALQFMDVVISINGTPVNGFGFSGQIESVGQTLGVCGAGLIQFSGGDILTMSINHHGGGADTTSLLSQLQVLKVNG